MTTPHHAPVDGPTTAPDLVLDLAEICVVRDGARLLDDIHLQVWAGERWVVLGPNGAGKTTLLQIVAGHLHPTSGWAAILGEVLGETDVFELRPRVGLASAALADRLPRNEKVRDVVLTAAYAVVGRFRENYAQVDVERAELLLRVLGMSEYLNRTFGTLSEGERKRVQIARALMADPELLLLDEPAAGLDLGGREDLVRRLSRLARDSFAPTMIMVTHHVEEIPPGITHVLMLRDGRVVASGELFTTLTEANLTACFGVPLVLSRDGARFAARLA
ncbi:MAG TPA: ABC transporter ATP-binding protein [Sporichthyaceae bacterium]|jgi:iron complex transport system ATP-binding protein